jgi:hypothetical protein
MSHRNATKYRKDASQRTSVRRSMLRSTAVLRRSMPSWGSLGEGGSRSPVFRDRPQRPRWPLRTGAATLLHMGEAGAHPLPPPCQPLGPAGPHCGFTGDVDGCSPLAAAVGEPDRRLGWPVMRHDRYPRVKYALTAIPARANLCCRGLPLQGTGESKGLKQSERAGEPQMLSRSVCMLQKDGELAPLPL